MQREKRRPPAVGRARTRHALSLLGAMCLLVAADYLLYPLLGKVTRSTSNRGRNGLWIRHTWVTQHRADRELASLARRLGNGQIRYVFAHLRSVGTDGKLRQQYPQNTRRLAAALHREAPGVHVIAWVYGHNATTGGDLDLNKESVRRGLVGTAVDLVTGGGFDGIQWDIEVTEDGNRGFLRLLDETRAALPPGKVLSVAAPVLVPWGLPWGWHHAYYREVLLRCDQLCVMGYDTGLYLPRAYVAFMRWQPGAICGIAKEANSPCRVLIGVPTYGPGQGTRGHHARAESLALALKAVREGAGRRAPENFEGTAIFADYTTDGAEWRIWRERWLE